MNHDRQRCHSELVSESHSVTPYTGSHSMTAALNLQSLSSLLILFIFYIYYRNLSIDLEIRQLLMRPLITGCTAYLIPAQPHTRSLAKMHIFTNLKERNKRFKLAFNRKSAGKTTHFHFCFLPVTISAPVTPAQIFPHYFNMSAFIKKGSIITL